ncbi:GPI ethanolamine phosphate transferase 2 [Euphorbia peplus]|nr:GPI ethanolamine phosphate transferase 2 [Euphorbia peplus]
MPTNKIRKTINCSNLTILTVAGVILQMIGLFLFVFGFFPVKPALSGVSGIESYYEPGSDQNETMKVPFPHHLKSSYQELSGISPLYDRLILMVIDGLPAEFVLGKDGQPPSRDFMEAMPYTQSLLANGMAVGYHAKAAPPTVTMPRMKAMVSGAIGGFLDVAFNFNTQAMLDDNLLDQFFRIGWKMVMLGDETWLKLFPGLFVRHDRVTSFFVKDTVQVDHNVSRHLGNELSRDDWNLLILHYLGLDHVGHIGGRNSFLMGPKLKEMDEVVKMIHLATIDTHDNNQPQTLLVVASDHGMTDSGNHGGSSYEETDSLALFVGLKNHVSENASAVYNSVLQVDIAPTLALLFGVPIPKNNVGVLISETFDSLPEYQRLRALELNSWQLLRLVEAQLPGLSCGSIPFDMGSGRGECNSSSIEREICCLYMNASNLHSSWKSKKELGSLSSDDFSSTVAAYYSFLETASNWLSRRVTDKPVSLLAFGIVALAISCLMFLGIIICMNREICCGEKRYLSSSKKSEDGMCLEEIFVPGVIVILVSSMGSSSMVEEEQYMWNFFISTAFLILLRRTVQSLPARSGIALSLNKRSNFQLCSIFLLLISGRILRGWHQGGVNWIHLPDISKWLEQADGDILRQIQLVSCLLVISLGFITLYLFRYMKKVVQAVGLCLLIPGFLVLLHIMEFKFSSNMSSVYQATILAQIIFILLTIVTTCTVVALPWIIPISVSNPCYRHDINSSSLVSIDSQYNYPLLVFRDCSYIIGLTYMLCWCLLQLLLQQPVNSMPVFLLLMQILTSMLYYSYGRPQNKEWLEIALLYYMGMAGHFALGNSNSLATIDVAGAFIGLSSYSTLLSGILMFLITYASPMLVLLSMVMYVSVKDTSYIDTTQPADSGNLLKKMIGFPCLVPLGLNSILLTAYTIVVLLMRNHLFVWSVFSPKYLYVCATTVCVHVGVFAVAATETYIYFVVAFRRKRKIKVITDKK